MNEFSKTRSTGFIILIVLLLVLILGIITFLTRVAAEDKLVRLGFVKLQQYSTQLQSKIEVLYSTWNSGNPGWKRKNYNLDYDKGKWLIVDTTRTNNDTRLNISDTLSFGFLDKVFYGDYIIFNKENVLYKTVKTEIFVPGKYLENLKNNIYLPASNRIFSLNKKKIHQDTTGNSGFITKSIINYEKFYQFVYPFKIQNQEFYISGFLTSKSYLDKKQHVETWVLIVIGILLILTLFSFPFFKLFLLSKTERLRTSDLVLICFSTGGIACVVTLLIINLSTLLRIKENSKVQLKILNDSIKSGFVNELNLMYQTVSEYEKHKISDTSVKTHILTNQDFNLSDNYLKSKIMTYPYFKVLFCSDSVMSANIITTWDKDSPSKISYRDYFKKKDEWLLPGSKEDKRFRLQSIYSNTSGDATAVLAKPSDLFADTVYCISSPMNSVINTVLPPGFGFRIIGQDGLVWFHNNQQKNTRENFLAECDPDDQIKEAIHNRVEASFIIQISMEYYQVRISPVGTLPLYIVTLSNTQEQNEFLSHINYVVFIFFVIGLLFAAISSAIFYYGRTDNVADAVSDCEPGLIWLLADSRKNKRYVVIFGLNAFLGLLITLPAFFDRCTILHFLLIIFSAYSICFMYTYLLLKTIKPKVIRKSVIIAYALIIVVCNIIYLSCLPRFLAFLIPEVMIIAIIGSLVFMVQKSQLFPELKKNILNSRIKFLWSPENTYLPYSLFMCSWLVIGCILPTIYIFRIAGREEVDLVTRKNQLEVAARIERKGLLIDSFYVAHIYPEKKHPGNPEISKIKAVLKQKGNYLLNIIDEPVIENMNLLPNSYESPNLNYLLLNRYLRLMLDEGDIRSYLMLYGTGLDTTWFWEPKRKSDILTFHYLAKQKDAGNFYSGYQLRLSSVLQNQKTSKMTGNHKSVIFFSAFYLLFLISLFLLIRFIIKKMFILQRPEITNIIEDPNKIPVGINVFLVNTLSRHQIVYRLDSIDNNEADQTPVTMLNPLPESIEKWNIFIDRLENLLKQNTVRTLLLSTYTPAQIGEIIEEQKQKFPKDAKEKVFLTEINRRLVQLFSGFIVFFIADKNYGKELPGQLGLNSHLKNELVIGNIEGALDLKSEKEVADNIELPGSKTDVYNMLISQYRYLWESCTTYEKFILSDLSTDSLVNSNNKEDINNLIGKRILDVHGKLCYVSKGFRRYVRELADTEELMAIENDKRRLDGWNKIKNPLYIIFGAIVVFFFFTQHDIITGINGAIISITGIIGTFLKVLSGRAPENGE